MSRRAIALAIGALCAWSAPWLTEAALAQAANPGATERSESKPGLHDFGGAFESRIDIAHVRDSRAARSAPGATGSGRGGRRWDRLSAQLFGLRCVSHTALRSDRAFIPNHFE